MLSFGAFVLGLMVSVGFGSVSAVAAVTLRGDLCDRNLTSAYASAAQAANEEIERLFPSVVQFGEPPFFSASSFGLATVTYQNDSRRGYALRGTSRKVIRDGRTVIFKAKSSASCRLASGDFDRAMSSVTVTGLSPVPPVQPEPTPCVPSEYTTCDPPVDCTKYECP